MKIKASFMVLLFSFLKKGAESYEERAFKVDDCCLGFNTFVGSISDEDFNYEIVIKAREKNK